MTELYFLLITLLVALYLLITTTSNNKYEFFIAFLVLSLIAPIAWELISLRGESGAAELIKFIVLIGIIYLIGLIAIIFKNQLSIIGHSVKAKLIKTRY